MYAEIGMISSPKTRAVVCIAIYEVMSVKRTQRRTSGVRTLEEAPQGLEAEFLCGKAVNMIVSVHARFLIALLTPRQLQCLVVSWVESPEDTKIQYLLLHLNAATRKILSSFQAGKLAELLTRYPR